MTFDPRPIAEATQKALDQLPTPARNGYSVTRWNLPMVATVSDNGADLMVSEHYCAHCAEGRHSDNGHDGEGGCSHKAFVRWAWDEAVAEAQAKLAPEDVDARREAFYQAGAYPPAPVYY